MAGKYKLTVSNGKYGYNAKTGDYEYTDLIMKPKNGLRAIYEFLNQVDDAVYCAKEHGESSTITLTFKVKGKK